LIGLPKTIQRNSFDSSTFGNSGKTKFVNCGKRNSTLTQKAAEFEAEQHKAALQESHERFISKYPEMKDRAKSEEAFSEITQYLLDTGFTKEEIQSVSDYRIIDILYQNVQLQKAQRKVPEVVAKMNKKPVLSAKQTSTKPDMNRSEIEQFNKTRSVNDAAALIKKLL